MSLSSILGCLRQLLLVCNLGLGSMLVLLRSLPQHQLVAVDGGSQLLQPVLPLFVAGPVAQAAACSRWCRGINASCHMIRWCSSEMWWRCEWWCKWRVYCRIWRRAPAGASRHGVVVDIPTVNGARVGWQVERVFFIARSTRPPLSRKLPLTSKTARKPFWINLPALKMAPGTFETSKAALPEISPRSLFILMLTSR